MCVNKGFRFMQGVAFYSKSLSFVAITLPGDQIARRKAGTGSFCCTISQLLLLVLRDVKPLLWVVFALYYDARRYTSDIPCCCSNANLLVVPQILNYKLLLNIDERKEGLSRE